MDLIMVEDGEEEPGEGRDEPREDAVEKEGIECPAKVPRLVEPTRSSVSLSLFHCSPSAGARQQGAPPR